MLTVRRIISCANANTHLTLESTGVASAHCKRVARRLASLGIITIQDDHPLGITIDPCDQDTVYAAAAAAGIKVDEDLSTKWLIPWRTLETRDPNTHDPLSEPQRIEVLRNWRNRKWILPMTEGATGVLDVTQIDVDWTGFPEP